MDAITVVGQDELEQPAGHPDVTRQVAFETADVVTVQSSVAAGATTSWHHNGDRHVHGYVVRGHARLEFGPDGSEAVALDAGDFVYVPPRTIRRVVNPTDEAWVTVISFVGSGPPATSVDGPEASGESDSRPT